MSRQYDADDSFLTTVLTNIFGVFFAGLLLILPVIPLATFYFLRRPISRALNLEKHSASWSSMKWLYRPIKWLAGFLCIVFIIGATDKLTLPATHLDLIIVRLLDLCVGLAFGFLFNILHWLERYAEDPVIQKKIAGIQAERYVQKLIEKNQRDFAGARSLHGTLFVFNEGTPGEFSVEADHILITERNIFLIETKYKSGTISAGADSARWMVSSRQGEGEMANALKQAKNAAQVLQRQAALPCEVIPLVAIKGNDVNIVDGPTNVFRAENLVNVLHAFEHSKPRPILDPVAVAAMLLSHIRNDKAAMERHIDRAQAARTRAEQDAIVNAASIR